MKLTKAQEEELKVWEYFIPDNCPWLSKTDEDIKMFFEWSEQGKYKNIKSNNWSYFEALRQGKRWAGIHWQIYEDGLLDGSMPYCAFIDKTTPRAVINQMKREMFQGIDAEIIENYYSKL